MFQNFFKSLQICLLVIISPFIKFQGSSFNSFLDILLTRLHQYFFKGHNSEKGHNPVKKKYVSGIFSRAIHIRNSVTVACTVKKLCYASKSVTNGGTDGRMEGRTDGRTNTPEAICSSNFLEVWGHKNQQTTF